MKRLLDIIFSFSLLLLFCPLFIILAFLIVISDGLPIIYWSERVGKNNKNFLMPKFRTMKKGTPQVATHLLKNSTNHLISIGRFLRRTSLDEIPQLWSILIGHMSFVGPRPALFNQNDLIRAREENGVHSLLPGVTGWAQINGRDDISIDKKLFFDIEYLEKSSLLFDLKIIWITIIKVLKKESISH